MPDQVIPLVGGAGVVPRGFERRVVTIEAGDERVYDGAEWSDSLVVVTSGVVELVGRCGGAVRLQRGDVTWLTDLPLVALRNIGGEPVCLAAVRRTTRG